MNKKKIVYILSALVLALTVLVVLFARFYTPKLAKNVIIRGYEINIPKNWSSDSVGNLYNKQGIKVGSFTLVDDNESKKFYSRSVKLTEDVLKYEDFSKDGIESNIYIALNLPNPEPYSAELVIFKEYVKENLADKIAKSFKIPKLGSNPPPKNIKPFYDENSVIKIEFIDGSISVKNTALLLQFSKKQSAKEDCAVNIISYKEKDNKKEISSWKYLESDGGIGYLYTYYESENGLYTYDNNPSEFYLLSKAISEEKSITTYSLMTNDKNLPLIEFPLNKYRDNAEKLVMLKTDNATSADVQSILDNILTKEELKNISFRLDNDKLIIQFGKGNNIQREKAYLHSAVLFRLLLNIDKIVISCNDDDYIFERGQLDKTVDTNVDSEKEDAKSFVEYTEKVEQTNINSKDGEVVYQATVVISHDTMITHPKTGKKVKAGPYAEKNGYGKYIGKPITCVIKRSKNAYIATASCGNSHIMSYPLEDDTKLNWAIKMIKAYS